MSWLFEREAPLFKRPNGLIWWSNHQMDKCGRFDGVMLPWNEAQDKQLAILNFAKFMKKLIIKRSL